MFGNVDDVGDVVMPGAFADTLVEWKERGDPIPVYWSHRMDDPDYNIGHVLDAEETDAGLKVRGRLDLESSKATQTYRLLKGRRVTQFSFAYDIIDGGPRESEDVFELRKLKLYEVSATPIGANQATELLTVKSRAVSAKNEKTLRSAREQLDAAASAIDDVLAALDDGETNDDQEKASAHGPAKTEEPAGAKADEPSRSVSVDAWAVRIALAQRRRVGVCQ